jgi:DNA-binding response OmpR family regulator
MTDGTHLLVVEDSPLDRALLKAHLTTAGYELDMAVDGIEALAALQKNPDRYDVVLLDRNMPKMNGMELLARMKENAQLRLLPVILQTAAITPSEILEGIDAGAYYYLTKPYNTKMLLSVVRAAANDYAEYKELRTQVRQGLHTLRLMQNATFSMQTVDHARDLGTILAQTCPDPAAAVVGLTELLLNAVEHGNLGITYEEKSRLADKDAWREEVDRRLSLPDNASKRVTVTFERNRESVSFVIRDEGPGFDWTRFLDVDPSRAFDTHGRGIAMARRLSFQNLQYNARGNEVTATIKL